MSALRKQIGEAKKAAMTKRVEILARAGIGELLRTGMSALRTKKRGRDFCPSLFSLDGQMNGAPVLRSGKIQPVEGDVADRDRHRIHVADDDRRGQTGA